MFDGEARKYAAALGRRYFAGTVTAETLFEHLGSSEDPLVKALLEAISHEPRRGFAGIGQKRWEKHFWQPVSELLAELEKGEAGAIPRERVYPKARVAPFVGWALFSLWAAAAGAEHAWRIWKTIRAADDLPLLQLAFRSLGVTVMLLASLAGLKASLHKLFLYRTRHDPYGTGERRGQLGPTRGSWSGLIDFMRPLLEECRNYPVYVSLKSAFWRNRDLRVNSPLPLTRVVVSEDTWELCLFADGLLRGNPVSDTALNLETFLQDLQRLSETAAHCRLVVSDERAISREGLVKLATRHGAQLDGIPPEELDGDEEYAARFDLPVKDVTILMSDDPPGITLQFIA